VRSLRIGASGISQLVPSSPDISPRITALLASLLILIADRISKLLILHSMQSFDSVSLIPGWLRIVHAENPGAAFGVLAEANPILRSIVLIGISGAVLVFVASALFARGRAATTNGLLRSAATRFGLAFILGGAIGNLLDRTIRGTVTDFIEVYHGVWSFPAFNIADSAITVGAVLLLFDLLKPRGKSIEQRSVEK
jgi:signal peptidase II